MKALSLWQFWASAVMLGLKEYETRSWPTAYHGPLIIHAAKRRPSEWLYEATPAFLAMWAAVGILKPSDLPLGAALGTVELVGCYRTELLSTRISDQERSLGDWTPGRWCWRVANVRLFAEPLPYRGEQGLFNFVGDLPEYQTA